MEVEGQDGERREETTGEEKMNSIEFKGINIALKEGNPDSKC